MEQHGKTWEKPDEVEIWMSLKFMAACCMPEKVMRNGSFRKPDMVDLEGHTVCQQQLKINKQIADSVIQTQEGHGFNMIQHHSTNFFKGSSVGSTYFWRRPLGASAVLTDEINGNAERND